MSSDVGLLRNAETASFDVGNQQSTTFSFTALLGDHTLNSEIAQQTRTMDLGYIPNQIYFNPADLAGLQNNGNQVSSKVLFCLDVDLLKLSLKVFQSILICY